MNYARVFKAEVVAWNRDRGLLTAGFDPRLELKMLSEEAREFYLAETLEHMLAEYADFLFVWYGTEAKFHGDLIQSPTIFSMVWDEWLKLKQYGEFTVAAMYSVLNSHFVSHRYSHINMCVAFALKTVINNNNLKGKKKVGGKVVKCEEQVDPILAIKAMMEEKIDGYQG